MSKYNVICGKFIAINIINVKASGFWGIALMYSKTFGVTVKTNGYVTVKCGKYYLFEFCFF